MAWGACAGLGICALALGYVALPWLLKGALWLFAALALEPALIPSRFRADERGVERSTLLGKTRLAWESARRWRRHRLGVELGSGRREWLPGTGRKLRLFIPARERGRVLAALERERARHGG